MKGKILVTYRIPEESLTPLEDAGYSLIWPAGDKMSTDDILDRIGECVAVVSVFGTKFPDEAFTLAPKLRIISNYGAGVDNINLQQATEKGIVVTNTPDEVTEPTAEMAIALMMSLAHRIPELDRRLRIRDRVRWGVMENLGTLLSGKTLGILGLGRIGKATARRAAALGMKVIYHNRHKLEDTVEKEIGVRYVSFDHLLGESDILSLHTPLTEETRHIIDRKAFLQMKNTALLINTARGAVIDEQALIETLRKGSIAGAALDVFEHEPEIPEALMKLDNVVIVPHIGTATLETRIAIGHRAALNILNFLDHNKADNAVNPEVLK